MMDTYTSRVRIRLTYCLALSFIAILTVAGYIIVAKAIEADKRHAEIINVAGKQRMFSQRIALLISQVQTKQDVHTHYAELDALLKEMEEAHEYLSTEVLANKDRLPALHNHYYNTPHLSDKMLQFIGNVRATFSSEDLTSDHVNIKLQDLKEFSKDELLQMLDQAVSLHEALANIDSARLMEIEIFIVFVALSMLLFEAFFIFLPLERKIILSQKDLEIRQKEAVTANLAKSEFLSNMSHEMRTPLNGIVGMVQMLSKTTLDKRQAQCVRLLESSAENMLLIVNDVLDFAKIEAKELRMEPHEINLQENLADATNLLKPLADEKELSLTMDYNDNLPVTIFADGGRLHQIWVNLIGNAIKFTQEGSIKVAAKGAVKDEILHLEVDIVDTGIGIAPENIEKIFGKFSQADSSTTRKYGGTGLGLTISRKLARLMQGDITTTSKVGHGSTFHVTLQLPITA